MKDHVTVTRNESICRLEGQALIVIVFKGKRQGVETYTPPFYVNQEKWHLGFLWRGESVWKGDFHSIASYVL